VVVFFPSRSTQGGSPGVQAPGSVQSYTLAHLKDYDLPLVKGTSDQIPTGIGLGSGFATSGLDVSFVPSPPLVAEVLLCTHLKWIFTIQTFHYSFNEDQV
jgi:hypothetical protein